MIRRVSKIALSAPDIGPRERELVMEVLGTPYLSLGPMLPRFEKAQASYIGTRHALGVSSGTAGLHLCIRAAGVGPGDEIITTPFSFIASANCILYEGARPVFGDIDPRTWNLDPALVEAKITRRTKALLPVHIFGQPCAMDEIMDIAQRYNLIVIEDACEALGAEWQGRRVGTFGDAAVFAFYPNKQMTTGEGGVIVTDREDWARLFCSLRNQGRAEEDDFLHPRLGYNYRLDELSCALGVAQMERLEELLGKRERVAQWYLERLKAMDGVTPPFLDPGVTRMSWFVFVVRLAEGIDRQAVMARLARAGIPTRPYFPAIHLQPFYRERFGHRPGDFPEAERVAQSTLALPFHGNLGEEEVDFICHKLALAVAREAS